MKKLFCALLVFLSIIGYTSCDEDHDREEIIKMYIPVELGVYRPWWTDGLIECMLAKEEHASEYMSLSFSEITGFEHEKGYEYELLVKKTTLSDPPQDGSNVIYTLIQILSKKASTPMCRVETVYSVDAEQKGAIETDLKNNLPVPTGGGYIISNTSISMVDANKAVLQEGSIHLESVANSKDWPKSYRLLMPDEQIVTTMKWTVNFNGTIHSYDVYLVQWGMQRYTTVKPWLYEDLTDYYQTKYPNAGVKGVVRVQILSYQAK